jgi:hypothetical protein
MGHLIELDMRRMPAHDSRERLNYNLPRKSLGAALRLASVMPSVRIQNPG